MDVLIEQLNAREIDFDCVVLGGDISTGHLDNFYRIMSKISALGKDIFYCLGNWDSDIPYEGLDLGEKCHHVHNKIIEFKGFYFSGFSGCYMGWGHNPIYHQAESHISQKHSEIIEKLSQAVGLSMVERQKKIDGVKLTSEQYERYRKLAAIKYGDRRTKQYKDAVVRINNREKLIRERVFSYQSQDLKNLLISTEYQNYKNELKDVRSEITEKNVHDVVNKIIKGNIPCDRLIFLSHARVDRFAEYFDDTPFCHMFGHRHGYMSSYRAITGMPSSGRTNFINISALDINSPKKSPFALPPNAVIAELNGNPRIESMPFYLDIFNSRIAMNERDKRKLFGIDSQLEDYYCYHKDLSHSDYCTLVDEFSEFVGWP